MVDLLLKGIELLMWLSGSISVLSLFGIATVFYDDRPRRKS